MKKAKLIICDQCDFRISDYDEGYFSYKLKDSSFKLCYRCTQKLYAKVLKNVRRLFL